MNLAVLSPNQNFYSETFIQAHRTLPFNVLYYYAGFVPRKLVGKGPLVKVGPKVFLYLRFLLEKKLTASEQALKSSLKKQKVDCVLAEYGITAAESLDVVQSLNLPLIVHFHGYDASRKDVLAKYKEKYLEVFKYAKCVVSVSEKMYADLIALGCPQDKILLNRCGPNPDFFNVRPSFKTRNFMAIGRFVDKKGPHLTITAFSKIAKSYPDARLYFAGDGHLLKFCEDLVKALRIEEQVFFLGIQSPSEISKLFSTSLAFVQHSIVAENGDSEGTPVAVLEASAAGLPVIATRHAGIPDVIEHCKTGFLVEELDVEKMAFYMKVLCDNPDKAKLMGAAGSQNILLNHSLEKHLNCLAEIITKAVGEIQ